jgi:hypothetical protein
MARATGFSLELMSLPEGDAEVEVAVTHCGICRMGGTLPNLSQERPWR